MAGLVLHSERIGRERSEADGEPLEDVRRIALHNHTRVFSANMARVVLLLVDRVHDEPFRVLQLGHVLVVQRAKDVDLIVSDEFTRDVDYVVRVVDAEAATRKAKVSPNCPFGAS